MASASGDAPSEVGYALIGAGRFGQYACQAYRALPNLHLRVVADADPVAAQRAADMLGSEAARSVDEALARDDVNLAYIAAPPWTHAELTEKALRAGLHVLCEKPLALDLEDARLVLGLARRHDRLAATNLLMRYNPLCEAVKRVLDDRLLGEPLHAYFENHAKDEPLPPEHWFWKPEKSGGIFVEHGVHFFDLFAWWLGECRLEAAHSVRRPNAPFIEQVQCTCRYDGDVLANFYHGFTQAEVMDRQEMCVLCERGTLWLREWVPTSMEIRCLADDATVATLQTLLPHAIVECLESFSGPRRVVTSRHKRYNADGRYRIRAHTGLDKSALYDHVLRSLLDDQLTAMHAPDHRRRVTEENGYASLEFAVAAQHLAEAHDR